MSLLASILAACIAIVLLSEPIHAVYIPGPNAAHVYKSAVASFAIADGLEVSLFMPVNKADCSSEEDRLYMPAEVTHISDLQFFGNISTGIFDKMKYKTCKGSSKPIDASKIPLVIFEPQIGTSRFLYSTLARFMAANGMAIAILDHPETSSSATLDPFHDLKQWNEPVTQIVDARIEDINLVLKELSEASVLQRQFPRLKFNSALGTQSYSIVGHGIGGTTATALSTLDPRVRFSINLSGTPPLLDHPTSATIYYFGRSDFRRENDIHWPTTWKYLAGRATEWDFQDAGIFDFSDLPWITDLARQDEKITIDSVNGLHDTLGPFGFHVNACFLEAYLKAELTEPKYGWVGDCLRMFDQMKPYPGGVH